MHSVTEDLPFHSKNEIAKAAYSIWERAGRPDGKAVTHWLEAEAKVRGLAFHSALQSAEDAPAHGGSRYGLVLRSRTDNP